MLSEPAEILSRPPEIHDIDRIEGRRFIDLLMDRGERRARYWRRSLDADIDAPAFDSRPRITSAADLAASAGSLIARIHPLLNPDLN